MADAAHEIPAPGESTLEIGAVEEDSEATSRFADRDKLATQVSIGIIALGFILMFAAWFGASGANEIQQQFPYLLSGAVPGLALVIIGGGILFVRDVRRERDALEAQIMKLAEVVERAVERGPAVVAQHTPGHLDDDLVVIGRTVFHHPDCSIIADKDDLELVPREEAEADGLGPCRTCEP